MNRREMIKASIGTVAMTALGDSAGGEVGRANQEDSGYRSPS